MAHLPAHPRSAWVQIVAEKHEGAASHPFKPTSPAARSSLEELPESDTDERSAGGLAPHPSLLKPRCTVEGRPMLGQA